jgi:hypothetical protein
VRRYEYPYNSKRYLLNANTNELHDLDNEMPECKIGLIKTEHITMFDDLQTGISTQKLLSGTSNGCFWCLNAYHTG